MSLSPLIERYLHEALMQSAAPLVLSFEGDWKLVAAEGDATRFGLELGVGGKGLAVLRDLFLGLPLDEPQTFAFVELAGGRSVDLHLVPEGQRFHLIVLDVTGEVGRQRTVQQAGHNAELASHEKSRAMRRLKKAQAELEGERDRLKRSGELKDALIATLSHEFRTPLASVFGHLQLMERQPDNAEARRTGLRAIRRATTHLFNLSENLLEYAREESGDVGTVDLFPIDLARLAAGLGELFRPLADDAGLALTLEARVAPETKPASDPVKLKQILINLIANAIRYTTEGSVAVRLEADARGIVCEVADTGPGIKPELRERIFRPFDRGEQRGGRGAGLGLAIVKRLAERLGGSITLDSELGRGSRFRVELPRTETEVAADVAPMPASGRGRVALVADDDPDMRELLSVALADAGFRVESVGDAAQLDARARALVPDLLLVDIQMPGMPGHSAVFKLRSAGYGGRVLVLSATDSREVRNAAKAAGADVFLTKPVDLERLLAEALAP
jgi:signal transduction histidine kinase